MKSFRKALFVYRESDTRLKVFYAEIDFFHRNCETVSVGKFNESFPQFFARYQNTQKNQQ